MCHIKNSDKTHQEKPTNQQFKKNPIQSDSKQVQKTKKDRKLPEGGGGSG